MKSQTIHLTAERTITAITLPVLCSSASSDVIYCLTSVGGVKFAGYEIGALHKSLVVFG